MQQKERAQRLAALHVKGNPLVLHNAWDAGSAKAIASAGSTVIATSSWAVAAAHGYEDGESIPLSVVEHISARIVGAVEVPVTVDVEGGYSDDPRVCAENVARLIDQGVAGINFEDRIVSGTGLHGIHAQCERITAIRRMADARGIPLFINARTDLFFGTGAASVNGLAEARERATAYAEAGASGYFVPGLIDLHTIAVLCDAIDLPMNVMTMPGLPDVQALADAGVARISHGPGPYLRAMEAVRAAAQGVLR
ncbi:isocitrate lyase/PEP mutase family protein [Montanilutibacter psychrotolerans]|uniref:Isocitrate lyase/phosphoenolpyruvate mutase family protein n=1 Tax=Montanilutibacter psychrotolerans TaxID=1327343 RepID=A0A3M8ST02_9GAMM|nr:isocitrate lyase/phosphoenolpyruvate mutase family protein [Lysobacter psychrotolerans]RNF84447.1 isocitrate lyase/phosphoenolpyruvate mutase family protein [Lysobacter psychrotolerans]